MLEWFPKNVSTYGGDIDHVFRLILYIVGFWFVLAEATLLYFILRYGRRSGGRASFVTGEKWSQAAWVLIPAAIVLVLDLGIDFAGARAYEKIKGEAPASDVSVQVVGRQFNWMITYPGPDGEFGTVDDLAVENEMNVPVGRVVRLLLRSEDVVHSFFVPSLRLKQDLVPGREIEAWFQITEPGTYEIACAELCGFGHYTMRGLLIARSPEVYDRWVEEQWPPY
ncbi:MAG: cytochrome c oxidase subunit II [Acidobacteriota bacterium]